MAKVIDLNNEIIHWVDKHGNTLYFGSKATLEALKRLAGKNAKSVSDTIDVLLRKAKPNG